MKCIFEPRSIAFVGATEAEEKIGGRRWKSLIEGGFSGGLYPIHPRATQVRGHRAYRSVRALPETPDLVIVAVASDLVPQIVAECADVGVGGVMVITGGFGEISEDGKRIEQEMQRILRERGARLVGPNCGALFSGPAGINIGGWKITPGPIALVSQSGNMAIDFSRMAEQTGIGFSRSVTQGNATDLGIADFIAYFLDDPHTKVVLGYVEGFRDGEGRRLVDLLRSRPAGKPVVLLKPGRSAAGRRAALSHTGALAGEDAVVDAALREAGIVRVESVEQAWHVATSLARVPTLADGAIAVLTDGGGHATTVSDALGMAGLPIADFGHQTTDDLARLLPARCPRDNPIDFAGEAEGEPRIIARTLRIALADPNVAGAVIVGHFGGYHLIGGPSLAPKEADAARDIVRVTRELAKPVLLHTVHGDRSLEALKILNDGDVPVFRQIEMPAHVLRGLKTAGAHARRNRKPLPTPKAGEPIDIRDLVDKAVPGDRPLLLEPEARTFLQRCGFDVPAWREVHGEEDCVRAVAELGPACALKIVSPAASHKSEIGGVSLNVTTSDAADAFRRLVDRTKAAGPLRSVLVTPMLRGPIECVAGAFRDPQFGPVVMAGFGGVDIELERDVAFRLAPVDDDDVRAMLMGLRRGPLFNGYRGRPALDVAALAGIICQLGDVMTLDPRIAEIDLNPVLVTGEGAAIADVRIALHA